MYRGIGVVVVVLVLFTAGCGAGQRFQQAMVARIGQLTINEAIATWGAPVYQREDPTTGETVMVWTRSEYYTYRPPAPAPGQYGGNFWGSFAQGVAQGAASQATTTERHETLVLGFNRAGVLS